MISDTINDDVTMVGGEKTLLANRYRIIKQLGQGGMGSVWLAEDTLLDNKQFAIKMLPSILVSNKRAYNQLKSEALVAMKLTHTNVVTLRAFEENNGNPFLVMDYIEGQTLDDYLAEKGKLSEDETIKFLKPIAAALDYAHGRGVVHRDVKPGNVMIAKDGTPYILDFGIAREVQETMTRVTGSQASGTLLYMSPEQLNGMPPSSSQDIYSFAAMAYECIKGKPPFSHGQLEHQILNNQPERLAGGPCASSIMKGLAKKPEGRPATCVAVLACTESARVSPAAEVAPRLKRKVIAATAILVAVAFLALLVGGICHILSTPAADSSVQKPSQPKIETEPSSQPKPPPVVNKNTPKEFHAQQGEDPKHKAEVEDLKRQLKAVETRRDVATEVDSQFEQLAIEQKKEKTAKQLGKMMGK
jgi:serine/threonine-protein kinase